MDEHKKKKHLKNEKPPVSSDEIGREEEKASTVASEEKTVLEEMKKKLEEKEKEANDYYDRLLRTSADFDNYKKRTAREKEELGRFANEDLIKGILPVLDSLDHAVDHSGTVENVQSLVEGLKMIVQQCHQALDRFGLSVVEARGKSFDPSVHEAMLVVETDQCEPNHVVEEFRKGYRLNGRLIRPATVSVSKPLVKEVQTSEYI